MPSNRRRVKVKVSPQLENMKAWGVQTVVDRRAHASSGRGSAFFFKKKEPKTLPNWPAPVQPARAKGAKFFLLLFCSQKRSAYLTLTKTLTDIDVH
jgi:hypothetical protein